MPIRSATKDITRLMASRVFSTIATIGISIAAMFVLLCQCRKPQWWPGRLFLWIMNRRHAGVTTWGLQHVAIEPQFTILDVGCGGGRTVRTLAATASQGRTFGIDYSSASVSAAQPMNAEEIARGRVSIQLASVSQLPFPDNTFHLVTAVETHYYWPEPAADMREVLRVLKPRGQLVIVAETYRGEALGGLLLIPMKLLRARYLTVREHQTLFAEAGFVDVAVHLERRRGWICVVARKREALAA